MTDNVRVASKVIPLLRDDGTRSAFSLGLPEDLREEDFIAVVEGVVTHARFVLGHTKPALEIVRGSLPPAPNV